MKKRIFTAAFVGLSLLTVTSFNCFSEFAGAQQQQAVKEAIADSSQKSSDKKLDDAVAALRHINQDQLDDDEKERKAKEIDAAWEVIKSFGQNGISRLKQEVQKVDAGKEKDDFFKLNASSLLWQIGRLNEAENVAGIWNSTPLNAQYNYVFYTAMDAANTRDAKALPMLKALLRDDKGEVYFWVHSMEVKFPLTHEFVWDSYGVKGLPVLNEVLQTSNNAVEVQSAISLLCQAQYLPALPRTRQLAASAKDETRRAAVRCLGSFSHPQDYEFLIAGLRSKDTKEIWHYAYALYEYGDERAVPHLIPLLATEDDALKSEVLAALSHLLTPASFEAVNNYCQTTKNQQEKESCEQAIGGVLVKVNLKWADYIKKPLAEREAILREIRNADSTVKKGERVLTHKQLLDAINEWTINHRLDTKEYGWVEEKHVLAAATAADIDLLLNAKASFYGRLSDECLYDVRRIDEIVKRLGRSRYKKDVGVIVKVIEKRKIIIKAAVFR